MSNNLELSKEQLKTLKLFSYYCASHGAKTATLSVYLTEGGSIDWLDSNWYSDSGTKIEIYDKIEDEDLAFEKKAIQKLVYLISFWYMGRAVSKEEFDNLLRVITSEESNLKV